MVRTAVVYLCAISLLSAVSAQYNQVKEYAGQNFFNDWIFFDNCGFPSYSLSLSTLIVHLNSR